MDRVKRFFDLSDGQLYFLSILCVTAVIMGGYLLIRAYAAPGEEAVPMPVFMDDTDHKYTGVFVLDPNTAPADSLELLPGIGRVLADRIVAYRQHERFEEEIDITNVKGIGPRLFERIKPYLRVRR
jgi:competence ComEA-like helix-hairpin-helix protein